MLLRLSMTVGLLSSGRASCKYCEPSPTSFQLTHSGRFPASRKRNLCQRDISPWNMISSLLFILDGEINVRVVILEERYDGSC